MAGLNLLIRVLSESVASIFLSPEQNYPPTNVDDQSDADVDELPSDDEEVDLIHHSRVVGDIEEGRCNSGGRGKETVKFQLGSKCFAFYLFTTTCGFIGSAFSLTVGVAFIIQCPGNLILPCLLTLMGASGAGSHLYITSRLFEKDFAGFRSYEEAALDISFVLITIQWIFAVFILYLDTIYNSSIENCRPEFYRYTVIANLIAILAYMVHCILKCCHRKKKE